MKILIVEDDRETAEMIKLELESESHAVEIAPDGADGSFLARSYNYDVVVLDYSLPKKNGLEVCDDIRRAGKTTPILFLSVADETSIKVAAFAKGADDYITKPFSFEELRARIKAVARRPDIIRKPVFSVADLSLDTETQTARRKGKLVHLTKKEFCLLEYLMRHIGKIVSRPMIMEHVWTADSDPMSNTVEAHMARLRKKLNRSHGANLISNIQGRGYIIDTPANLRRFSAI
ncbi:response regulator transcription factor [Patescibacteria group bacterium]|nr:response regulator transcription factor [Patescibacteria group bacterium]MDE1946332.1 response regulator transcription factor [Patescibacteria group bacterium]MDE2010784.1 response regulator transcription factor [Patescibacteria group bacterium]MDE2232669.1 response regulator transcription factor [Patescibacteria group bacterium]